jgi:uncharacterized protein YdaU (DUF1376 family)
MAKNKKSLNKNGQEYQPAYQFWHEKDFSLDEQVAHGMDWLQRHLYRTLLQKAYHCSTRPYLPISDDNLWLLADAGSKERWLANKDQVMVKFFKATVDGIELWAHKRLLRDWDLLKQHATKKSHAGREGGFAKAENKRAIKENDPLMGDKEGIDFNQDDV